LKFNSDSSNDSSEISYSSDDDKQIPDKIDEDHFISQNKELALKWFKYPNWASNQATFAQVIEGKSGPTRMAMRSIGTFREAFKLILNNKICNIIMKWTNKYGRSKFEEWEDIDESELDNFFAVLILIDAYRAKKEPIIEPWSKSYGRPVFDLF
jgi:hypothetical protein